MSRRLPATGIAGIVSAAGIRAGLLALMAAGIAGCATAPTAGRTRMVDLPFASTRANAGFTLMTGSRQSADCIDGTNCPAPANLNAASHFARQVQRVAADLQKGAQSLYPDLAERVPGLVGGQFDVYVVDADEPGSASSANGRIALNAALGVPQPYDDWIAFVIAREMGHVIARHHEENSAAGIATSVIMNILVPGSALLKFLMSTGGSGIASASGRDVQALEADAVALELLKAAGFQPRDIYLTLLIEPAVLDEGAWSGDFRKSSDNFIAEFRRSELATVIAKDAAKPLPAEVPQAAESRPRSRQRLF